MSTAAEIKTAIDNKINHAQGAAKEAWAIIKGHADKMIESSKILTLDKEGNPDLVTLKNWTISETRNLSNDVKGKALHAYDIVAPKAEEGIQQAGDLLSKNKKSGFGTAIGGIIGYMLDVPILGAIIGFLIGGSMDGKEGVVQQGYAWAKKKLGMEDPIQNAASEEKLKPKETASSEVKLTESASANALNKAVIATSSIITGGVPTHLPEAPIATPSPTPQLVATAQKR